MSKIVFLLQHVGVLAHLRSTCLVNWFWMIGAELLCCVKSTKYEKERVENHKSQFKERKFFLFCWARHSQVWFLRITPSRYSGWFKSRNFHCYGHFNAAVQGANQISTQFRSFYAAGLSVGVRTLKVVTSKKKKIASSSVQSLCYVLG